MFVSCLLLRVLSKRARFYKYSHGFFFFLSNHRRERFYACVCGWETSDASFLSPLSKSKCHILSSSEFFKKRRDETRRDETRRGERGERLLLGNFSLLFPHSHTHTKKAMAPSKDDVVVVDDDVPPPPPPPEEDAPLRFGTGCVDEEEGYNNKYNRHNKIDNQKQQQTTQKIVRRWVLAVRLVFKHKLRVEKTCKRCDLPKSQRVKDEEKKAAAGWLLDGVDDPTNNRIFVKGSTQRRRLRTI